MNPIIQVARFDITKQEIECTQTSVRGFLAANLPKHFPIGTLRRFRVETFWARFEWDSCELNYRTYKVDYNGAGRLLVERLT
jgi:hypothetical protein